MRDRPEIYLDMDGVCVDFMAATLRANGFDASTYLERWREEHPGSQYPEALLGRSAPEFFTHEHMQTSDFWSGLVPYPWFEHLYAELERLGHVVFLTAPTAAPGCVAGKHEWLNRQFGHGFTDFIFTRHKDRLAHGNAFLVDDLPSNIKIFDARGGTGLLFPQIWNELNHIDDPTSHVVSELERRLG